MTTSSIGCRECPVWFIDRAIACAVIVVFALAIAPDIRADPIRFEMQVVDGPGKGFNDPALGQQRRQAFQFAASRWGGFFQSSFPGETINLQVSFAPISPGSGERVGDAMPRFVTLAGTRVPSSLLEHRVGGDFNPQEDGRIRFDEKTNFFLGTSGDPGDHFDFVTLAMHEIGHVVGFASALTQDGTYQDGIPTDYDRFVSDQFDDPLVNLAPTDRLAASTSGDGLFWTGSKGIAGDNGDEPNLSAGRPFIVGTNVWHLSDTFGAGDLLMDAALFPGDVIHDLAPVESGMLADLGWTMALAVPEPSVLALIGPGCGLLIFWLRLRERRLQLPVRPEV
jgi:hypothetical protein